MKEKIKLFIVDDHELLREGIRFFLETIPEFEVVGEAGCADEFFEQIESLRFDIAILDINLPGASGIEIAQTLNKVYPFIRTIIYTANVDEKSIVDAVKAGAMAYLPKDTAKRELPEAIENVCKNRRYISPSIAEKMMAAFYHSESDESDDITELSDREREVLIHIAKGLSYKETGNLLYISDRTVETHKNNMLKKLKLKNKVELIKYAIEHKLI